MMDERREGRPTAYVLGEMTAEEKASFEAEMKDSAELTAEVDEIREMAALLGREMAEGRASLPPEVRARIEAAASEKQRDLGAAQPTDNGGPAKANGAKTNGATVVALPAKKPFFRRASVWMAAAAIATLGPAMLLVRGAAKPEAAFLASEATPPAPMAAATAAAQAQKHAELQRLEARLNAETKLGDEQGRKRLKGPQPSGQANQAPRRDEKPSSGDRFDALGENQFLKPTTDPLSTFSIDVDTASYALVRTHLQNGNLPPDGAVRIEEMVNYFGYSYPEPEGDVPFRVQLDLGVAPWAPDHRLVRVGLKGKTVNLSAMDGVNLVFLVDTSGSMSAENKLPLLKKGLRMMVDKLGANDRIAIVAYAGSAGLVLPSTSVKDKSTILGALERLSSGGSTNGGAGIDLAYKVASQNFLKGGVNRVILATDGDFNVGTTSNEALVNLIQEKAKTGVFLSVLGFGMGNFNDSLLEKIADKGNGQYAYIDSETEAKRALVDGLGSLITIAKDVKIQIEWNPAEVAGYRLIGYENRTMAARDFNDDRKDAGELGSGHTVTALYEVIPAGGSVPSGDGLKYQTPSAVPGSAPAHTAPGEMLTVELRYKEPDKSDSKLLEGVLKEGNPSLGTMSRDFKFAAAVASFGMLLRKSKHAGNATFASVLELAEASAGDDAKRQELVQLVRKAQLAPLAPSPPAARVPRDCDSSDPLCVPF